MEYKLKPHTATVTTAIVLRLSYCKAYIDSSIGFTEGMCVNRGLIAEIQKETSLIG
jgi:hypothetical protein